MFDKLVILLKFIGLFICVLYVGRLFANDPPDEIEDSLLNLHGVAQVRVLNKITAKTELLDLKVGETRHFGDVFFKVTNCWASGEFEVVENAALLEVAGSNPKGERLFRSWILSSSPNVSCFQHPVYDISLVKCHDGTVAELK